MDDEDEIEVTEEILSFHSNVRENIVSFSSIPKKDFPLFGFNM